MPGPSPSPSLRDRTFQAPTRRDSLRLTRGDRCFMDDTSAPPRHTLQCVFVVTGVQILPPTSEGRYPTAGGHPQVQLAPDMDGRWLKRSSSALWQVLYLILMGVHVHTPSTPGRPGGGNQFSRWPSTLNRLVWVYMLLIASHRTDLAWPDDQGWALLYWPGCSSPSIVQHSAELPSSSDFSPNPSQQVARLQAHTTTRSIAHGVRWGEKHVK